MRVKLFSVMVVAGVLSFGLRHEAAAAPVAQHLPSVSAGGSIENIYYYYHGRHYAYRYHGNYYAHRSYYHGHWRYY